MKMSFDFPLMKLVLFIIEKRKAVMKMKYKRCKRRIIDESEYEPSLCF